MVQGPPGPGLSWPFKQNFASLNVHEPPPHPKHHVWTPRGPPCGTKTGSGASGVSFDFSEGHVRANQFCNPTPHPMNDEAPGWPSTQPPVTLRLVDKRCTTISGQPKICGSQRSRPTLGCTTSPHRAHTQTSGQGRTDAGDVTSRRWCRCPCRRLTPTDDDLLPSFSLSLLLRGVDVFVCRWVSQTSVLITV